MSGFKMIDNAAIVDYYKLLKIKSRRCFKLYFVLYNITFSRELNVENSCNNSSGGSF
jgi:hypothetical protein